MKYKQGFSLIEIMVALLIVSIALGGAIYTVGISARNETIISNATFARWVAMNQIAKIKLEHAWPSIGNTKGDEEMAGGKWVWKQKTRSTENELVRRIEISVWREGSEKENPDAFLVGFLAK